jgi:adenosylcobinamide kinase/adenosylcobinamide-phosphate guanylyltransferase
MRIILLGTGGADGWPNPWCTCASCGWMREHHEIRGQTSALVDDVLLLDCGPEAPRAALRHGHSLTRVRHLLFTHAHPDHTGAAALMWRAWTGRRDPLDVAGPPAVLAECRRWVSDDVPISWHVLQAGDELTLGEYRVRALAAAHGDDSIGPALVYDVSDHDDHRMHDRRMLWATDTRQLPSETLAATRNRRYDAVLLEETNGNDFAAGTDHLDLRSWPATVAELRRVGAVTDTTQLLPIHLSHGNPPLPRLRALMDAWGARVPDDGEIVDLGAATPMQVRPQGVGPQGVRPQRVLVIGGARSGKSRFAESLLAAEPDVTYVATSLPRPDDVEWQHRIEQHRKRRPAHWRTVESLDIVAAVEPEASSVLECLTLWLGALLDEGDLDDRCDALVRHLAAVSGRVVVVSNEVGDGVVPVSHSGRRFRDELGTLNARVAAECDEVWRVTAGIPVRLA